MNRPARNNDLHDTVMLELVGFLAIASPLHRMTDFITDEHVARVHADP